MRGYFADHTRIHFRGWSRLVRGTCKAESISNNSGEMKSIIISFISPLYYSNISTYYLKLSRNLSISVIRDFRHRTMIFVSFQTIL